jgi:hypothetical protein
MRPPADLLAVAERRSEDISEQFFSPDGEASLERASRHARYTVLNCRAHKSFYSATHFAACARGCKNVFGAVYCGFFSACLIYSLCWRCSKWVGLLVTRD